LDEERGDVARVVVGERSARSESDADERARDAPRGLVRVAVDLERSRADRLVSLADRPIGRLGQLAERRSDVVVGWPDVEVEVLRRHLADLDLGRSTDPLVAYGPDDDRE